MKIDIQKYDPSVDSEPYFVSYDIEHTDKMTVLEAIQAVHENGEVICFDYSCHGRMCGRCSVMLDGTPVLACCTPIDDAAHSIEPLAGFPVLRDLIVDKSTLDDRIADAQRRVALEPITADTVGKNIDLDGKAQINDLVNCTRCGCCQAACPVYTSNGEAYAGPAVMVATTMAYYDSYDKLDRVVQAVHDGLYQCIMCGRCDDVCPRPEIKHLERWKTLRQSAEEKGLVPSYATK